MIQPYQGHSVNPWFCCDYLPKGQFSLLLSDVITSTRHLRQTKTRPPTSDDIATVAMRSQAEIYLPPCGGCRIQVGKGCHIQRNFVGINLFRGPTEDLFSYIVQNGKRKPQSGFYCTLVSSWRLCDPTCRLWASCLRSHESHYMSLANA